MKTFTISAVFALPFLTTAFPTSLISRDQAAVTINGFGLSTTTITAADLKSVAPSTASCSGSTTGQCVTADQAAPAIADSFKKWGIVSFGSQAAIISTILFESNNFQSNVGIGANASPGKGTRNMQSADNNAKYAQAVGVTGSTPDDIVSALNKDVNLSFGSAAWFLATQCSMSIRDQLHGQETAGFSAYITQCVNTGDLEKRTAIWNQLLALKKW
ncbi:MAG: hypothetical protein M1820_003392 [Bogoriella megaspora]|nr:MAG: hypothetical protein M1820_003392 [Bogoriella megaspora]